MRQGDGNNVDIGQTHIQWSYSGLLLISKGMYSALSVLSSQMTTIVYIISSDTCRLQYENTSANLSLYVDCGFVFNEKFDHICISILGRHGKRCVPSLRERHTWQAPHLIQVKTFIVNCLFNECCYAILL